MTYSSLPSLVTFNACISFKKIKDVFLNQQLFDNNTDHGERPIKTLKSKNPKNRSLITEGEKKRKTFPTCEAKRSLKVA